MELDRDERFAVLLANDVGGMPADGLNIRQAVDYVHDTLMVIGDFDRTMAGLNEPVELDNEQASVVIGRIAQCLTSKGVPPNLGRRIRKIGERLAAECGEQNDKPESGNETESELSSD